MTLNMALGYKKNPPHARVMWWVLRLVRWLGFVLDDFMLDGEGDGFGAGGDGEFGEDVADVEFYG